MSGPDTAPAQPDLQPQGNDFAQATLSGGGLAALIAGEAAASGEIFTGHTDGALEGVLEQISDARARTEGVKAEVEAGLSGVLSEAESRLGSAVERERSAFAATVTETGSQATAWASEAGGRAEELVSGAQERGRQLGSSYGDRARQAEQQVASETTGEGAQLGQQAIDIGERKASGAGGSEEARSAKARTARELATDTRDHIVSGVRDAVEDVGGADELAEDWDRQGQEFADSLDGEARPAVEALREAGTGAARALHEAGTEGTAALDEVATGIQEGLSRGPEWQAELQNSTGEVLAGLDEAEAALRSAHAEANAQSMAAGQAVVAQVQQQVVGVPLTPSDQAVLVGEVGEQLRSDHDEAGMQAAAELTTHGQQIVSQALSVPDALRQDGQQAVSPVEQAVDDVERGLSEDGSRARSAMAGALGQVQASGDQALAGMSQGLESGLGELEGDLSGNLETFTGELDEQMAPALEQARDPLRTLPGRIDEAHAKIHAEVSEQEEGGFWSWLGRQFSNLWDMVTDPGFIAGILAGIVLTALVILLAPAELGLLAIIGIGAAIAAVAALVGTVVHNAFQGKTGWDLFDGALEAMLIGGLFGAVGGLVLGLMGIGAAAIATLSAVTGVLTVLTNLATGQPWDQNLLANVLLAGLFAWLGGRVARMGRSGTTGDAPDGPVARSNQDAPDNVVRPEVDAPEQQQPGRTQRPARAGSQENPVDASGRVAQRNDGTFRLNRKNVRNANKIEGEPEATNAVDANREVVAAERAASRSNVDRVIMGEEADRMVNGRTGQDMSADAIGVTRDGRYVVSEAKGMNIEHGLEQLQYTGDRLGRAQVVRYELVIPERINTPGYTVQSGTLHVNGQPVLINGKPVHVTFTTQ